MKQATQLGLIAAAVAATAMQAGVASAQEQPWLSDRRVGEGMGYRTGNLELHWGAAAEGGYDSNYFELSDDPEPVWRLRLTPSFHVSTLGEQRRGDAPGAPPELTMRAGVWLAYNELFAADADDDYQSDAVTEQRHLDYGADIKVDIGPGRPLGVDVYGAYVFTAEPSRQLVIEPTFDRGTARGGAGVSWRPGGGGFEWRLGYELDYNYFSDAPYDTYDNFEQSILTRGRLRFLPRSAILYDAEYTFVRYTHSSTTQTDGDYVQARLGVNGLMTSNFAFLALAGWASTYYVSRGPNEAQNYDGLVAHLEGKWFLLPPPSANSATVGLSSIAAGYVRSLSNSYLGSFFVRDRGYVNFSYFAGGVFLANIEAGYSLVHYPDSTYSDRDDIDAFTQNVIDLRLFGEYRFSDVFGVNSTFLYEQVISPSVPGAPDPQTGDATEDELAYSRWQFWLGLRYFM